MRRWWALAFLLSGCVTHAWTQGGSYEIGVHVGDDQGATGSAAHAVSILAP